MSHPLPAWFVKRAGGTDKKIPLCFRKDKRKGQSSQILTRNRSSVAEETPTASQQQPNHSQLQAVKAAEEDLNPHKTFDRIHFYSLPCLQHKILFLGQLLQLPPVAIHSAPTLSQLLALSIISTWTTQCSPVGTSFWFGRSGRMVTRDL